MNGRGHETEASPNGKGALLLIVWNDGATEQREEEKNNAEGRKKH